MTEQEREAMKLLFRTTIILSEDLRKLEQAHAELRESYDGLRQVNGLWDGS